MNLNTPILLENLRKNLCDVINGSGLFMCEVELVMKDVYAEVKMVAQKELQDACDLIQQQTVENTKDNIEDEIIES